MVESGEKICSEAVRWFEVKVNSTVNDAQWLGILDGDAEGWLLGMRRQPLAGSALRRYVMIARHSGSIEARPKAGPQT